MPAEPIPVAAAPDFAAIAKRIKVLGRLEGFGAVGIADVDLSEASAHLTAWLENGFHGQMDYMARNLTKRSRPGELVHGTVRVISVRMDYLGRDVANNWVERSWQKLSESAQANISLYAQGRDYHKVLRSRLQQLADRIALEIGPFGYRVFTDSAPVMEVELARRAALGWRGKHTLLLTQDAGSMFFLGEIFVDLPLPVDGTSSAHCGSCSRCIAVCPTAAIVAPFQLDARRCISYLTIELDGPIPEEFRVPMGNRIYGCDDCQLICPWNKYAKRSPVADFDSRGLDEVDLLTLFAWDEAEFLERTLGSAIRRIGFERWQRNIAVALGNVLRDESLASELKQKVREALQVRHAQSSALVQEHIEWALRPAPTSVPA